MSTSFTINNDIVIRRDSADIDVGNERTSDGLCAIWWPLERWRSLTSHSARIMRRAAIGEPPDEKPKSKTFTRRNRSSSESNETFWHRLGFENLARSDCYRSGIGADRGPRNKEAEAGDLIVHHEEFKVIDLDAIWTDEIYPLIGKDLSFAGIWVNVLGEYLGASGSL